MGRQNFWPSQSINPNRFLVVWLMAFQVNCHDFTCTYLKKVTPNQTFHLLTSLTSTSLRHMSSRLQSHRWLQRLARLLLLAGGFQLLVIMFVCQCCKQDPFLKELGLQWRIWAVSWKSAVNLRKEHCDLARKGPFSRKDASAFAASVWVGPHKLQQVIPEVNDH